MRYKICAVLDSKLSEYGQPFFVNQIGQAVRSFGDEVLRVDANNNLNKHPEDFTLWHIGEFDSETAELFSQPPRCIASASEYAVKVK